MKRPNILLIQTDQQRWDALGVNGNPHIQTPHLDQLAAEGINFNHCFVQSPVCMPSRASLFSGQYPSTLGLQHMAVPVPDAMFTMHGLLHRYGYRTGCIGKLHFLPHGNRDHREPHPPYDFDHLEISDEPGCYEDAYRAWVRRKAPGALDHISVGLPPAAGLWYRQVNYEDTVQHPPERILTCAQACRMDAGLTHSAFVGEQAIDYLRKAGPEPFFLAASFYSPHSPWVAPREFLDRYDPEKLPLPEFPPELDRQRRDGHFGDTELRSVRQGYYAMVTEVDHHVGRILAQLEESGLAEDTIVVFTSDHGEWLGEHLRYGKGYWAPDCISRVPLIIRWPAGIADAGKTHSEIVEAVDIAATLLSAVGVPAPRALHGNCLLPDIAHQCVPDDGLALTEYTGWRSLRLPGRRYVCTDDGEERFFDLEKDPGEYHNVADDFAYGSELADVRRLLVRRMIGMERPHPLTWIY